MPPKKTEGASAPKSKPSHPSYQDMITQAIVTLKDRNGSSRQSLKKFVKANNNLAVTDAMFDSLFNKALRAGVEKGVFEQPKGASGGTKLAKKASVKKEGDKVKKPTVKKDTKKAAPKKDTKKAAAPKKEGEKKKAAPKKEGEKKKAAPKKASADKSKTAASKPKASKVTKPAAKKAAAPKKAAPKKAAPKKEKAAEAA